MPTKRKQPSRAPSEAWPARVPLKRIITNPQPSSKATPSAALKTKRSADECADDASTTHSSARPAKRMKTTVNPTPKATSPARTPRQRAAAPSSTTPTTLPPKKSSAIKAHNKSATKAAIPSTPLIPHIPRQRAMVGQKDESLLRIMGKSAVTQRANDLRFRLIPHASIDWNNPHHIAKINSWRNQIYQRAGIKTRLIVSWHKLEELWMELYYQLSIAEARQRNVRLPSPRQLRDAFNQLFAGRVLKNRHGKGLQPRGERLATAFGSKFNRMFPVLKARLHACAGGKKGKVFMPEIRFGMLLAYKAYKAKMGVEAESENAVDEEEWQGFLEQLYDVDDKEEEDSTEEYEDGDDEDLEDEQDLIQEEEDDEDDESAAEEEEEHLTQEQEAIDLAAKEADAIDALLSLASLPANTAWPVSSGPTENTTADGYATPELTRSTHTSFSQAESVRTPPEQCTGRLQGTAYIADGYDNVDNPAEDMDGEDVVGCKACDTHAAHLLLSTHRLWAPDDGTYLGE
ncbi:hypothetical protein P3342_000062 [Pyrenophora teres f. teres]|nr:hypothetical protein P3342_000062 [Pyrenophora teres f. teres]